jgi:hypothetical protein
MWLTLGRPSQDEKFVINVDVGEIEREAVAWIE